MSSFLGNIRLESRYVRDEWRFRVLQRDDGAIVTDWLGEEAIKDYLFKELDAGLDRLFRAGVGEITRELKIAKGAPVTLRCESGGPIKLTRRTLHGRGFGTGRAQRF